MKKKKTYSTMKLESFACAKANKYKYYLALELFYYIFSKST